MPDLALSVVVLAIIAVGWLLAWIARAIVPASRKVAQGTLIVVALIGA